MKLKYWILFAVSFVIIILDQYTKSLIQAHFYYGESVSVLPGFFNLTSVRNTGAAFGMLANAPTGFRVPFFIIIPIVALVAIAYIYKKIPKNDYKLSSALSLVIGGATGNLIDRVQLGYVVDFLDFHWKVHYHFPAFNVADSAICVGLGILSLDLLFGKSED
ncbi:MAG: signal peptidase II [Deltaproteobacteria bacterium]|nr:signal peptidase II [Deltaproteobacteria bacterium]